MICCGRSHRSEDRIKVNVEEVKLEKREGTHIVDADCFPVNSNSCFMSFPESPMREGMDGRSADSALVVIQRPRKRDQCAGRAQHRCRRHVLCQTRARQVVCVSRRRRQFAVLKCKTMRVSRVCYREQCHHEYVTAKNVITSMLLRTMSSRVCYREQCHVPTIFFND